MKIQNQPFSIDFYVLPLQGANLVLGIQWLELLGSMTINFKDLKMEFMWENVKIIFQGDPTITTTPIQFNQLRCLTASHLIASCYQSIALNSLDMSSFVTTFNLLMEVKFVLTTYKLVFDTPTHLPPVYDVDHRIHL